MNCKHLKIKMKHSFECKKTGKIIDIRKCNKSNCKCFEYKEKSTQQIKKRSSKLAKIEKNRYSIFTSDLDQCIICGAKKEHIHEIYFGSFRQRSIKLGMCIPLCSLCHQEMHRNSEWQEYWHIKGQEYFEEYIGFRNEFMKIFGKLYKR